jgi:hypothetical protein
MVDLTNAPEGSLWINRRGDVLRVGDKEDYGSVKMHFVSCETCPQYARDGNFVRVFLQDGISYYGTANYDIVSSAYTECPY